MTKSEFVGGALSFKGDKKKSKKKKSKKSKHKLDREEKLSTEAAVAARDSDVEDEGLTEAERRALKFKRQRQQEENEKIAKKSHRERVEELNEKLSSLTEHNDIPRVSAAGNG